MRTNNSKITKLSDYDFDLPKELIAQKSSSKRDHSNLLILSENQDLTITKFYNIIDYLNKGDVIVLNDSKVMNAKLNLKKSEKIIELYLNKQISEYYWKGFARPARKLNIGDKFYFDNHHIIISNKFDMGEVEIQFCLQNTSLFEFLDQYGQVPLPPYIKRTTKDTMNDKQYYQTVYSQHLGSVAAPTAGLHFTNELLHHIKTKKIKLAFVTLHVGAGTFLPVKTENIKDHKMHSEYCSIDQNTADIINQAKKNRKHIIAVGTTTLRTLETMAKHGVVNAGKCETQIFITPGFKFQVVDKLITNFHLPRSTLLMLVCAFSGYDHIFSAYKYAIENKMRFFSYGDAMLLSLLKT